MPNNSQIGESTRDVKTGILLVPLSKVWLLFVSVYITYQQISKFCVQISYRFLSPRHPPQKNPHEKCIKRGQSFIYSSVLSVTLDCTDFRENRRR